MKKKEEIIKETKDIYSLIDKEYFTSPTKCSDCNLCCTNKVKLVVSPLEIEIITEQIKDPSLLYNFKRFLNQEIPLCPFYNADLNGRCLIYSARPFICRIIRVFNFDSMSLKQCPRKDELIQISKLEAYSRLPFLAKFLLLKWEHLLATAKTPYQKLRALIGLGEEYLRLEQIEKASELFKQAQSIYPTHPAPAYFLGIVAQWQENWQEAVKWLKECIETGGESFYPEIHKHLGFAYLNLCDYELALSHFRKRVSIANDDPSAHLGLTMVYWMKAIEHCEKVLEIEPNNETANYLKGILC